MNKPVVALLVALAAVSACRPFAVEGESCTDAPCAYGLVCFEEICVVPSVQDAGPPPCESDGECGINGNDDGRVCSDGRCEWAECSADVDCGTRVCDRGECSTRETCVVDDDCGADEVCEDEACRAACSGDSECGGFAVCADDGQCRQQCFIDLMCFGDLCVDGVCTEPECDGDGDCARGEGSFFCNAGRCESFLPCAEDDDCFDANFQCTDEGRCEERPLCTVDDDCGAAGLCLDFHCRPTEACAGDGDCDDGDECVAGRCVAEPACRDDGDCDGDDVCSGALCREPIEVEATSLVLGTPYGPCRADGTGACDLVLVAGEAARLQIVGVADDGAPSLPDVTATAPAGVTAAVGAGGALTVTGNAAGSGDLSVTITGASVSHSALTVHVVAAPSAGDLGVLVVDADTGAPVSGATLGFAGATTPTAATGLGTFATPTTFTGLLTVEHDQAGVALDGVTAAGVFRVALRQPPAAGGSDEPTSAGFTARVTSTGDETDDVGIGLALPSTRWPSQARLATLFGETVTSTLEVPVLGGVPVQLPAATTFEATLPVQGNAVVKELAYARAEGGPLSVTAFEGRQGQGALFDYLGGGDPVGVALDLAGVSAGFDVLWQPVGVVDELPLIGDDDDWDGDGDTTELAPDWAELPEVEVLPSRLGTERVGVRVERLPNGARARAFALAGHWLPGWGFAPAGMGVASLIDAPEAGFQLKAHGPRNDALAAAHRVVLIEALFEDGRESRARVEASAFGPNLDAGELLSPPTGAFFVDGLPNPGERTLFLPAPAAAAPTTYRVRVVGGARAWEMYLAVGAGGRNVVIPPQLGGLTAVLVEVALLRLDGMDATDATLAPFRVGDGPAWPLEELASAIAVAPSF